MYIETVNYIYSTSYYYILKIYECNILYRDWCYNLEKAAAFY